MDLHHQRVCYDGVNLLDLDALAVKKIGSEYSPNDLDRLEILRYVRQSGVPVFSKPESIMRLLDRLACTVTLRLNNIPMPPTVVTEDLDEALAAVERFERVVLKPLFSTKGFGVGVGLPTAKRIMQQHGGGIEITSEPGRGTRAHLWLPLCSTQKAAA